MIADGIHENVSFEEYLKIEAINASSLRHASRSMAHVRAALDGLIESDTKKTRFGTLVHTLALEPASLDERYVMDPGPERFPTKDGASSENYRATKAFKDWAKEQLGRLIISAEELAQAKRCVEAVKIHPESAALFGEPGQSECTIVWEDPATGVRCKARIDWLTSVIVDLKTTQDASRFETSIMSWHYDVQAAFYRRGILAITGELRGVALVAVESEQPHGVRAAEVDPEEINRADMMINEWLGKVRVCQESGVWSGYEPTPFWRMPRVREVVAAEETATF